MIKSAVDCVNFRVKQAQRDELPIVDVDCSYYYKKYMEGGHHVIPPPCPSSPLSGWRAINKDSYQTVGLLIPMVTAGTYIFV